MLAKQARADLKEIKEATEMTKTDITQKEDEERVELMQEVLSTVSKRKSQIANGRYAERRRMRRQAGDSRVKWSEETLIVALKELYEYCGGRPSQKQCRELGKTRRVPSWITLVNEFGPPQGWDEIIKQL